MPNSFKEIEPPAGIKVAEVQILSKEGENFYPMPNRRGDQIIYSSQNRSAHKESQVYMMDLQNQKETRFSFQDGNVLQPYWTDADSNIFYVSSTDEIKEDFSVKRWKQNAIQILQPYNWQQLSSLGFEVYSSLRDGSKIVRLTRHKGFDGTPVLFHHEILFSTFENNRWSLHRKLSDGSGERSWLVSNINDWQPAVSLDQQKVAWIRWDEKKKTYAIMARSNNGTPIVLWEQTGPLSEVSWHPSGQSVVFASAHEGNWELYALSLSNPSPQRCLRRLTYHTAEDRDPHFTADGQQIFFASNRTGAFQIYKMKFAFSNEELINCPVAPTSSPSLPN